MLRQEWWQSAPEWAKYHTWDKRGKAWFENKPFYDKKQGEWERAHGDYYYYDIAPLPVELDPKSTLRVRN